MEWRTLKEQDLPALLAFCRANEEYYSYMEQRAEEESLREQLTMLPPKATAAQPTDGQFTSKEIFFRLYGDN